MAIRRCMHDGFGGDIAAGAGSVVDNEWLAEPVRKPLCYDARLDVGGLASRKADDNAHRPRWISLRLYGARREVQRGSASDRMQNGSAMDFHVPLPRTADLTVMAPTIVMSWSS